MPLPPAPGTEPHTQSLLTKANLYGLTLRCFTQSVVVRIFLLVLAAAWAFGENYVRVDSAADHRSYTIDVDQTAVQRSLRLVSASVSPDWLPAWLYPTPQAQPTGAAYDIASGVASARFACGGTVDQTIAFYTQVIGGHGFRVSTQRLPGNRGAQLTGTGDAGTVGAIVESRSGVVQAQVSYAPRQPPAPREFAVVWYDDRTGVLRLRDTANGAEYELPKRAIVANNVDLPGGVTSDDAGIPPWFPLYPGAAESPTGRIQWMFKPTAEYVTNDSIRQVYEFYLEQIEAAGAVIHSKGLVRSGTPARDSAAHIVALKGDGKVEIRISEVTWIGPPSVKPGPKTGIGVLYSVPKH